LFYFFTDGPDTVSITPTTSKYTEQIGDNIGPVNCSADCNPACSYTWSRTGSSPLILNNLQKTDSGDYVCTATNSQGNKKSPTINVDVQCKIILSNILKSLGCPTSLKGDNDLNILLIYRQ